MHVYCKKLELLINWTVLNIRQVVEELRVGKACKFVCHQLTQ